MYISHLKSLYRGRLRICCPKYLSYVYFLFLVYIPNIKSLYRGHLRICCLVLPLHKHRQVEVRSEILDLPQILKRQCSSTKK
jgi:hypothetical protein